MPEDGHNSPASTGPFALLGVDERFELNRAALDQAYFRLQSQFHPDRFVGKPEAERIAAAHTSMAVNEAYQQLKDPQHRAEALLKQHGVVVNTEKHDTLKPDAALLMEMMELGESLDEQAGPGALAAWLDERRQDLDAAYQTFAQHYAAAEYAKAAQAVIRAQYLRRLIDTAQRRLRGDKGETHRAA